MTLQDQFKYFNSYLLLWKTTAFWYYTRIQAKVLVFHLILGNFVRLAILYGSCQRLHLLFRKEIAGPEWKCIQNPVRQVDEFFGKTVHSLKPLTIFSKSSILGVGLGTAYDPGQCAQCKLLQTNNSFVFSNPLNAKVQI